MKITDKLMKPIKETSYLNTENSYRYRCIIRYFYEQYGKINYWLYKEEVFDELKKDEHFQNYTIEECQYDFNMLTEWGNLISRQDSSRVMTVEEYLNRNFRYQLSEYTVEIERMTLRLENMFVETSSLEPKLLERIRSELTLVDKIREESPEEQALWWDRLSTDFKRLNQNYQDYLHSLNSVKAEEMMKTKQFLIFKDQLINYLTTFVSNLQINAVRIEASLRKISSQDIDQIFQGVLHHELQIPRLEPLDKENFIENMQGIWKSIRRWFLSMDQELSETDRIMEVTNEIIQKITRYANNIIELHSMGANRKEEYKKVADIFALCENLEEAHLLSSHVFGVPHPMHLRGEFQRTTDSINSGVYEEPSYDCEVSPRVKAYKERAQRNEIPDYQMLKEEKRQKMLKEREEETDLINSYIQDGKIDFSTLPQISGKVRTVFLRWISKAMENSQHIARSEDGRSYRLILDEEKKTCFVHCDDGILKMPAYTICFEEDEK